MTTALAAGGQLKTILDGIKDREREREQCRKTLAGLDRMGEAMPLDLQRLEVNLRARLTDWHGLAKRSVVQARQIVRKLLVGRLIFRRMPEEPKTYEFTGQGTLERLMAGTVLPNVLVSPTGFEPVLPA